jgi:hypothetical protein
MVKDSKHHAPAVQVQVNHQYLAMVHKTLIEIYFVPSLASGTMPHELYYQHLCLHHQHIINQRSFAITNVSNLKAILTITDPDGTERNTTFKEELLNSIKPSIANEKLFYSIKLMKFSDTEAVTLWSHTRTPFSMPKNSLTWFFSISKRIAWTTWPKSHVMTSQSLAPT